MPRSLDTPLPYPEADTQADLPGLEEDVLTFWADHHIFEASVQGRAAGPNGANEYVFYDGPPFANGLPHYGHLLTGFVKDVIPRYQTMRGRRVERRFGWDCHGLPAETAAEIELGVSGRGPIIEYGVDRFNDHCRTSVLRYTHEWEHYVTRQARWVDFRHDYKTMDQPYMESVIWAFKTLHDKGLLYEGQRVLPYCWECETPLSNFEIRQDDSYRDRQDPAITIWFELDPVAGEDLPVRILVWTTTPWTLPSNLALAVGPQVEYSLFEKDGARYVIGAATTPAYAKQLEGAELVGTLLGADLVGRTYQPLFPYFASTPNAFRVLGADFVSTEEGTGVVHIAPGFGEDDQRLSEAAGIPVIAPVDSRGQFTGEVPDYAGLQVFAANSVIIRDLRERGVLLRHDSYVHSYPHCWRSDTPLIYKAVSSWFVRVTAVKERMLQLNQQINWVPAHVRDGAFGKWLEGARDWSITRNRFWGSPIPVWKSDDPAYPRMDVYGSLDELERDFGVRPADLHRPAIDELVRPNPDDPTGRSMMRRVEDVLDCWFESGSMPFAQVHYPFEHREWFEHHFPGDFIVEYVGQTRGWFYTLHVLATALFDRPAFKSVIAHGILLGDDGRKMSKRLNNYPDPDEMFATLGADAVRWSLMASAVLRGGDLVVHRRFMVEALRQALNPIWNTWSFFTLYANAEGLRANLGTTGSADLLDRYVLSKTAALVEAMTRRLDDYDIAGACAEVTEYLDALTNWYIRRSRDRFYARDQDAFNTLGTVLEVLCRVTAPLAPLITESVWRGLTGASDSQSVHLTDWPSPDALPADPGLVAAMDRVREVCSAAHSIRKAQGLRARLPLASLTLAGGGAGALAPYVGLITDEVNVKEVRLADEVGDAGEFVLTVKPAVAGPRLGPDVQKAIKAVKSGSWDRQGDGTVVAAGIVLEPGEFELTLRPADDSVSRAVSFDALVTLDVATTPELAAEGLARDVARLVNEARRTAKLHVSDRIELGIDGPEDVLAACRAHERWLADQTLAVSLREGPVAVGTGAFRHQAELPDGRSVTVTLRTAGASRASK
jgi:isoleucyl-tRNA synthetase